MGAGRSLSHSCFPGGCGSFPPMVGAGSQEPSGRHSPRIRAGGLSLFRKKPPKYLRKALGPRVEECVPTSGIAQAPGVFTVALGPCSVAGDFPGKGDDTHSSTLAWKIPWTEEPGGLQSMESLRVRHD